MRSVRGWSLILWLLAASVVRASDFNAEALLALLDAHGVRTVEGAIALLPDDMRANYVLVFASRSLQQSSLSSPRAVLYGTDANFIVSFNGDPSERGYDAIETMQFDSRTNSFHFREIAFAKDGGGITVSADNPARCGACHGAPARPIWDTAPSWPGVYGERYRAGLSKGELAGVRSFLAGQAQNPRYRLLIGAERFADRSTYVADSRALYDGETFEPPNARLSVLLATLNVRSLVSEMTSAPAYAPHRYALLGAATGNCGDVAAFFPERLRAPLIEAMDQYSKRSADGEAVQDRAKRLRRTSTRAGYQGGISSSDPVALRFVAERLVNMPTQRWSLALEGGTYDLAAPEGALTVEQLLFDRLTASEPELRDQRTLRTYGASDQFCAELRRRSERALAAYYGAATTLGSLPGMNVPAAAASPSGLDRCIGCHTGEVGPALPFADPQALGGRLAAGGFPHGRLLDEILFRLAPESGAARMPRGTNLAPAEQHNLEEYFVSLAAQHARHPD